MTKQLQQMRCTIHNLEFAYDADRVRALKQEPALMECPMCSRKKWDDLFLKHSQAIEHRDLLLSAIDLKRTLEPAP